MPASIGILSNHKVRIISLVTILTILLLSLYRECFVQLIAAVLSRRESSHGLFVPFISAFFLWERRGRITKLAPESAVGRGAVLVSLSLALLGFPENSFQPLLAAASFFIMAGALILAFFGRRIFNEVSAPLFFLMTMIPLPAPLYAGIAEWMRSVNTENAVFMTRMLGVPFERTGYYLQFPDILLRVDESCSGIRYFISYCVFGIAYAFFYRKTSAARIVTIASILPLSIFASSLRLLVIFLAAYYLGAWTAEKTPHVLLSWSVFAIILFAAVWADWKLSPAYEKLFAKRSKGAFSRRGGAPNGTASMV